MRAYHCAQQWCTVQQRTVLIGLHSTRSSLLDVLCLRGSYRHYAVHGLCRCSDIIASFGRPFVKTVRPMLSVRCLSVLSVCDVGVLWPNGWTDQDETWQAGRPRPRPPCVRWGPSSPSSCCGQTAGWIKIALGVEVGLGLGHIMLDGDPAPLPKSGRAPPPFRPLSIVDKRLDGSRCQLV